ncbi:unnamed protein product [Lactuca virosa]|uniref:RING-type E3 ubiquitin transferase n=1 Tax=Lactuca virosa TaxID=75947 RepID=A0AAU9NME6_9ASTR|nr:unnamed protein product [Lactuca virosa]
MASSPVEPPSLQHTPWSPLVIAMVGTMGTLFLVFSYFNILRRCSFHVYSGNAQRRRLRDTNLDGNDPSLQFQSRGLDSFAVQMIPVTQFKKKIESDKVNHCDESTECSICLGEYEDDDWVKTIPNCSHVFHVSCIDTWFQTHSNCPLCRSDIFDLEFRSLRVEVEEISLEKRLMKKDRFFIKLFALIFFKILTLLG